MTILTTYQQSVSVTNVNVNMVSVTFDQIVVSVRYVNITGDNMVCVRCDQHKQVFTWCV